MKGETIAAISTAVSSSGIGIVRISGDQAFEIADRVYRSPKGKKKLSELAQIMEVLPQALVNAKVPNHKKESYMEYSEIAEAIGELEKKFAGEGRVLIRPSGTEPLVRVMIEGKELEVIQQEAKKLADLITRVML